MIFSTKQPTKYRRWILHWTLLMLLGAGIGYAISTETGILGTMFSQLLLPVGWFVLIALDVKELKPDIGTSWTVYSYPFLAMFLLPGLLLYLWDRERQLPDPNHPSI